jgi:hypothetical protein
VNELAGVPVFQVVWYWSIGIPAEAWPVCEVWLVCDEVSLEYDDEVSLLDV